MKLTSSETREIKFGLMYMGVYPNEPWTTASKAVMKSFKKRKFNVVPEGNRWRIRKAV